jgi:nitrate reductase NapE component
MGGQSFAIIFGNKKNMKFGFKVCRIWPLNSIAMAGKFGPNEVSL